MTENGVLCKHKKRETLEFPGGHRETGEAIAETAKRELMEETGAVKFEIRPICVYSVTGKTRVSRGGMKNRSAGCFMRKLHRLGRYTARWRKLYYATLCRKTRRTRELCRRF